MEEARALGQFRWSQFSPAGSLERSGFFLRQAVRRSERPEWQKYNHVTVTVGWSLLAMFYGAVALAVVFGLVHTTTGLP